MYYIAICDDDSNDITITKNLLTDFFAKNNIENYIINEFYNGIDFLKSSFTYDIVFLDIFFSNNELGLEIAKKLKERKDECKVVFVSTSPEYAIEGYRLNIVRYIKKPLIKALFFSDLKEIACEMIEKNLCYIDQSNPKIKIKYSEIMYIDVLHKTSCIYTTHQKYSFQKPLSFWEHTISSTSFIRVHHSYIVNLAYIKQIKQYSIILKNDIVIPLSRAHKNQLKTSYADYLGKIS